MSRRVYPHMCRDGHVEIGHRDSEHEMCPLCRLRAQVNAMLDANVDYNPEAPNDQPALDVKIAELAELVGRRPSYAHPEAHVRGES